MKAAFHKFFYCKSYRTIAQVLISGIDSTFTIVMVTNIAAKIG